MMRISMLIALATMLLGCDLGANSPRGFSLPEGNIENGKQVFVNYRCVDCHSIADIDVGDEHRYITARPIPIGGSSPRIKTYGELVTSVINPSHKISGRQPASVTSKNGQSLMRNVNDELSVTELIDLVAYLQSNYKLVPYRTSEYRLYQLRVPGDNEN